jgi:hypothetical protein
MSWIPTWTPKSERKKHGPRTPNWTPKVGDKVRVCYDGKLGRCEEGTVLETKGFAVKVRYIPWAADPGQGEVEQWFVRHNENAFGGYLREPKIDFSLMRALVGTPGDWYSVYPLEDPNV